MKNVMKFVRLDVVAADFRVPKSVLLAEFRSMTDKERADLAREVYRTQKKGA